MATVYGRARIPVMHGTEEEFIQSDPILLDGEIGYTNNAKKGNILKFGDGTHKWSELNYKGKFVETLFDGNIEADTNEIVIDLGREVSHLKVHAILKFPDGTMGGKALTCVGESVDRDWVIAYRSSGLGSTTTEMNTLTLSSEWDYFTDEKNYSACVGKHFAFVGSGLTNSNAFGSGNSVDGYLKPPTKIKIKVGTGATILAGSYILVEGY